MNGWEAGFACVVIVCVILLALAAIGIKKGKS